MVKYKQLLKKSKLIKKLKITNDFNDGTTTFFFKLKDVNNLWGYNVEYSSDGDIEIFLKKKPKISDEEGSPFKNLNITLDPGHGVVDPGACNAPDIHKEKNVNLANAIVVKNQLLALGAKVLLHVTMKMKNWERT